MAKEKEFKVASIKYSDKPIAGFTLYPPQAKEKTFEELLDDYNKRDLQETKIEEMKLKMKRKLDQELGGKSKDAKSNETPKHYNVVNGEIYEDPDGTFTFGQAIQYLAVQKGASPQQSEDIVTLVNTLVSKLNVMDSNTLSQVAGLFQQKGNQSSGPPVSPSSWLVDTVGAIEKLRGLFAPPAAPASPFPVKIGEGQIIEWENLKNFVDHQFNLQIKREDHEEKKANVKAARENAPALVKTLGDIAMALKGTPSESSKEKGPSQNLRRFVCPFCNLEYDLPADITEAACPRCAVQQMKAMQEMGNAGKASEGESSGGGESPSEAVDEKEPEAIS